MTSFPRQHARTRRFTLGVPRAFTAGIGPDGPLVLFLRTDAGDDPVTHLWRHDASTGESHKLVDARALGTEGGELPAEERARRERAREQAGGIVAYAADAALTMAAFSLAGRLFTVDVASGELVEHPTAGPAFDPRPAPGGARVAYHAADGIHLVELPDGPGAQGTTRPVVTEPDVAWGRAEFVAAEEMGRSRGFWWAGDGRALAIARVDESAVPSWTIADPANPWSAPVTHAYPAAGTTNADVSLWVVDLAEDTRTQVRWDRRRDEYLGHVAWGDDPLTVVVQPRDQRTARVLTVDPSSGTTTEVRSWHDAAWVELVPGSPRWSGDRLLTVEDRNELGEGGSRALCLDGEPISPPGLQVRELLGPRPSGSAADDRARRGRVGAGADDATDVDVLASPSDDPTRVDRCSFRLGPAPDGAPALSVRSAAPASAPGLVRVVPGRSAGSEAGRSAQREAGRRVPEVEVRTSLDVAAPRVLVRCWPPGEDDPVTSDLEVVAETPVLTARPRLLTLSDRELRAALLLPSDHDGSSPLPVLLDPYGGPHAQRVLAAQSAFLTSQWLADQGFAVLVVDGRGSPGRGPAWERAVHHDLATPVLEDQIAALHAAAAVEPRLDLSRVAIRGWSFGGYLAALAALRRPDVFHAAIAGAPVTDWRLYDTHYTERYLGHPDERPDAYVVSSLIDGDTGLTAAASWDGGEAPGLLLIHGLADDNVVAAHALRLSSALLADGRVHRFLPLPGVTHMTPQETVAEQLLAHQVAFLRDVLG